MLERLGGGLGWTVARIPFDVATTWKKMVRLRVKVEIAGEVFRTSLFADSAHRGHFVLVNKKMQRAAGVKLGGMIDLTVEPDLEEREAEVPAELEKLLKQEKALAKWYPKLSENMRREIGKNIDAVKGAEARQRRAELWAERLMWHDGGREGAAPGDRSGVSQRACRTQGMGGDDCERSGE